MSLESQYLAIVHTTALPAKTPTRMLLALPCRLCRRTQTQCMKIQLMTLMPIHLRSLKSLCSQIPTTRKACPPKLTRTQSQLHAWKHATRRHQNRRQTHRQRQTPNPSMNHNQLQRPGGNAHRPSDHPPQLEAATESPNPRRLGAHANLQSNPHHHLRKTRLVLSFARSPLTAAPPSSAPKTNGNDTQQLNTSNSASGAAINAHTRPHARTTSIVKTSTSSMCDACILLPYLHPLTALPATTRKAARIAKSMPLKLP